MLKIDGRHWAAVTGAVSLLATAAVAQVSPSPPVMPVPPVEIPVPAAPPAPPIDAGGKVETATPATDCTQPMDGRGRARRDNRDQATILSMCAETLFQSGRNEAALDALSRSDAAGTALNNAVFDGSIGLRNAMMRAFILNQLDRRDEAVAEIERVRNARRYSVAVQWSLDRLLAAFDGTLDRFLVLADARVPDHPDLLRSLFLIHLSRGNVAAALPYAATMSLENPTPIGGWQINGDAPATALAETTEINAMRAYVFAANGDGARSRAMLTEIDRDITAYVGPAPVAENGREVPRRRVQAYQGRVATGRRMEEIVDRWKQAIAARARMATGTRLTVRQLEREFPQAVRTTAIIDLVMQLSSEGPEDTQARAEALRGADANLTRQLVAITPRSLIALLPEGEALDRYPRFGRAGDGILMGRDRGYSQAVEDGTGIRTIRFGTVSGSATTADELTLLAAATYAEREGFDSFILLSRRNVERQMRMVGGYSNGTVLDHGSEGQVRLILTNSAALPAEWQTQSRRVIMARQVIRSLGARQDGIEAARTAASQQRQRN